MTRFLEKLDSLAVIETENKTARLLERIAFVFLVIMVLAMPHSIAATQTAWLIGMLCVGHSPVYQTASETCQNAARHRALGIF